MTCTQKSNGENGYKRKFFDATFISTILFKVAQSSGKIIFLLYLQVNQVQGHRKFTFSLSLSLSLLHFLFLSTSTKLTVISRSNRNSYNFLFFFFVTITHQTVTSNSPHLLFPTLVLSFLLLQCTLDFLRCTFIWIVRVIFFANFTELKQNTTFIIQSMRRTLTFSISLLHTA